MAPEIRRVQTVCAPVLQCARRSTDLHPSARHLDTSARNAVPFAQQLSSNGGNTPAD